MTILTMVTGELDYQDVFSLSYDTNESDVLQLFPYSIPEHTANIVWVVFLVLIPILLTNMLVSAINFWGPVLYRLASTCGVYTKLD